MPHLCGLKLAHPVSAGNLLNINILIGADHYWDIVGDKIIRGNGPTAMESKLGYLISGPITPKATANRKTSAMTVIAKQETEGGKPENNDPISYHISRYTANRQRKSDHSPLPVKESIATQRMENVDEPLMQPQLLYRRSIASLPYSRNEQDSLEQIRNTGNGSHEIKTADVVRGDGIARSAVIRTKNGLSSRPAYKFVFDRRTI